MTGMTIRAVLSGLRDSVPVAAGYIPIAFSFGLAALQAHLLPVQSSLISLLIYAGASQFIFVSLLSAGSSVIALIATVLLMNVRHLFYGPAIYDKLGLQHRALPTPLLAFGLTDEVFATVISKYQTIPEPARVYWYLGLQLGAYLAWQVGTLAGIFLGDTLISHYPALQQTLGFILPALFFTLLLEIRHHLSRLVVGVTAAMTAALTWTVPIHLALLGGMLAGALAGSYTGKPRHADI
jgi:4-azaleucine resistance transporter AzlC